MDATPVMALVCAALIEVAEDVGQLEETGIPLPADLIQLHGEHAGMKAALQHARGMLTEAQNARLNEVYKQAEAHGRALASNQWLPLKLLPETMEAVETAMECLRRERILDPQVDEAMKAA